MKLHRCRNSNIELFDGRKVILESIGRGTVYESKPCVITMWRDITERKQAEEKLQASEERFRILFEDGPDATFIESLDDRILAANAAASRMFGYTRDEFKTMTVADLQAPEACGKKGTVVQEELPRNRSFEALDIRKDGTVFPGGGKQPKSRPFRVRRWFCRSFGTSPSGCGPKRR